MSGDHDLHPRWLPWADIVLTYIVKPYGIWIVKLRCIRHADIHKRAYLCQVSDTGSPEPLVFDTWLWHSDLYHVSPFQAYRTFTTCLQCDLEFFIFAVMKTFVTVISASTGRNDFICDIWLWHGDLYRVSPFQVYCTSTSCLPCDLQMNEWGYS